MLERCWGCEERHRPAAAEADGVLRQRGKVCEQAAEAVDGKVVVGALECGLALGGGRDLGLGNGRRALRRGRLSIVIVEEDRGKRLTHMPFEMTGEHAEEDVRTDPG